MKNLKMFFVLVVAMLATAMTFTACTDDNDDKALDANAQKQYMTMMSGSYTGKMRMYYADMSKQKYVQYDSLQTMWQVRSDSTLTISSFPVSSLDSCINVPKGEISSEATQLRELQQAIGQIKNPIQLQAYYYIPVSSFISNDYISFFVNPVFFKQTLNYNGADHDVYFVFLTNSYGGNFDRTGRLFEYHMYLQSVSIDKKPVDYSNSVSARYFRNLLITCYSK